MDAIREVQRAEAKAAETVAEGREQARRILAEAAQQAQDRGLARQRASEEAKEQTIAKAEREAEELVATALARSQTDAAALRKASAKRVEKAAGLVVERIVSGRWRS